MIVFHVIFINLIEYIIENYNNNYINLSEKLMSIIIILI